MFFYIEPIVIGIVLIAITTFIVVASKGKPKIADKETATDEKNSPSQSEPVASVEPPKTNVFLSGLQKSRALLSGSLDKIFTSGVDEELLEELEEALLIADVGPSTTEQLLQFLQKKSKATTNASELKDLLKEELLRRILPSVPMNTINEGPLVILVVGVNGSGKTTTIGKLANKYKKEGKKVLLAAGDTFRAGAIEQLEVWSERAEVEIVLAKPKSDPASVLYRALETAKANAYDVVICDTAGRLQAQSSLMDELAKMSRAATKVIPGAPHETLLVLDSTIGQNALLQAEGFKKVAPVSGVALTKLDGTAKGGIVIAVRDKIGIPVKLVGLGEGIDDLHVFDPHSFVDALLEVSE